MSADQEGGGAPPSPVAEAGSEAVFELAALSDVGTDRPDNEDSCGQWVEHQSSAVFAVADGVGGYEGGEIASKMAIETTLEAYRESSVEWGPAKRLQRAVQRANIEIHNRALIVPELRRMATTLTAGAVIDGTLYAAHVGDSRLYLVRHERIQQMTKDHTVIAERVRMGVMSAARARNHPERSALSRSLGRELIVSVDRITMPLMQGDRLIVCSDGLYNVLEEHDLVRLTHGADAAGACRRLIDAANQRGTADNLTVVVFKMIGPTPGGAVRRSWRERIVGLFGRGQ